MQLLAERQKLIKIADRSDHGWGVVAEYTADELADDSDDEKRILKAERAAERKAAKRKKSAAVPPRPKVRATSSTVPGPSSGPLQQFCPVPQSYRAQVARPRQPGPCFACGESGHIQKYCTKFPDASNKKWYPSECLLLCDGVGGVCMSASQMGGSTVSSTSACSSITSLGAGNSAGEQTRIGCAGLAGNNQLLLDGDFTNVCGCIWETEASG